MEHLQMMYKHKETWFLMILLAAAVIVQPADAANPRLKSVQTLIEQSSAAQRIEAAGIEAADEKREQARRLLREAEVLDAAGGDAAEVDRLLSAAAQEMMSAVRLVDVNAPSELQERELLNKTESLQALMDAYIRIQRDEHGIIGKGELQSFVESSLQRADELAAQGSYGPANEVVDEAYIAARTAIEHLRGGETLVRTLHFETKAEEYAYEVDRNDSLRMLIDVLLTERVQNNQNLAAQVDQLVDRAETLREDGESLAATGNYESAITTLETSTSELIKAIRSAGIYIPQ